VPHRDLILIDAVTLLRSLPAGLIGGCAGHLCVRVGVSSVAIGFVIGAEFAGTALATLTAGLSAHRLGRVFCWFFSCNRAVGDFLLYTCFRELRPPGMGQNVSGNGNWFVNTKARTAPCDGVEGF
jgi:hypothetical protein